jgi:hypothetical protein
VRPGALGKRLHDDRAPRAAADHALVQCLRSQTRLLTVSRAIQKAASRRETASGINAVMLAQVSMLRLFAHSLERFAGDYQRALDETRAENGRTGQQSPTSLSADR